MSNPQLTRPPSAATPVPSSPPAPSESFLSDIDGGAPSIVDTSYGAGESTWDGGKVDPTILNLVSWKLDVNARSEDGVEKRGFNAISTVLNHPTKKADPLRSSRKPLPPLSQPPPTLPKPPPPSYYDGYLQSITPLYDAFISSQATASASTSHMTPMSGPGERVLSPPLALSEFDGRPPVEDLPSDIPPLDSVPSIFFDPEFSLSNAVTWSELIASPAANSGSRGNGDEEEAESDMVVQDELSSHLDTLERHLIHEISLRSSSFFSALSNLQDLHSESASCLSRISELQSSLKEVGTKQARKGIEIIDAQERLRVLKVTEKGVRTVGELEEMLAVAKRLVDEGDWNGGLGYVEEIVRWWDRYSASVKKQDDTPSTLALSTLPGLSTLPSILEELTSSIATQLEISLASFLLSILSTDNQFNQNSFVGTLEPMLVGLVRCGKVDRVETVWRDAVTVSIREGSRKHLPVSQQDDDTEGDNKPPEARGASLAQSLQGMDHTSFLVLTAQMYGTLLARIQLAQQVGNEVERVLKSISSLSAFTISTSATATVSSSEPSLPDFADVLTSGCELAHSRSSKILAVRSEQHASLPIDEFVEIFKGNWDFILSTEKIAGRMIVSLRSVTASQARAFLVSYHAVRLTKSAKLVEEEQWTQIDVLPSVQHVVDLLIESAVSDPSECSIPSPLRSEGVNGNGSTEKAGGSSKKQLSIEDKSYFVVKATAESLVLLGDYLKVVINLELVVTDVMSRVIEFLKSFNSRTCQVVLGAGAMRSAGLKNITAKHLALASQSLSIIITLIPYIREFVRRHLSPKQAVMLTEFDKLKRDYQEHQNEIHAKLVAIMSDRLAVHVGSLREIDWEASPAKDGPRPYAEMLVKETATLHKVLSKYLSSSTVETVMSEVISAIAHRLSEEYGKVDFKSEEAKKRMLQDIALITIRLKPLSTESGGQITSLETTVKEKPTPRKAIGATMSGLLRRNGSKGSGVDVLPTADTTSKSPDDEDEDEDGGDADAPGAGAGLTEEPGSIEVEGGAGGTVDPKLALEEAGADLQAAPLQDTEGVSTANSQADEGEEPGSSAAQEAEVQEPPSSAPIGSSTDQEAAGVGADIEAEDGGTQEKHSSAGASASAITPPEPVGKDAPPLPEKEGADQSRQNAQADIEERDAVITKDEHEVQEKEIEKEEENNQVVEDRSVTPKPESGPNLPDKEVV